MPSSMLEQEAHRFGLREEALPFVDMASPQQMQTKGLMRKDHRVTHTTRI